MKIRIWQFIQDNGDGSMSCHLFPSEQAGRKALNLNDEDFQVFEAGTEDEWIDERPTEIESTIFNTEGCEEVL